jgi:serine/threonine protein kinase
VNHQKALCRSRTIAMQIADALEYAHEKDVIHQDLNCQCEGDTGWSGEAAAGRIGEGVQP